jgi:phosphoglycerate dehydrogenase-like enzyme
MNGMIKKETRLLINLPSGFFVSSELKPIFDYLEQIATVRKTSHNTQEEIIGDLSWAEAVIMWAWPKFSEEMLEKCSDLKFVGHINGTQTSIKNCFKKGIAVSEARHAYSEIVAEMALGLILSGFRKISQYHMDMRNGTEKWINGSPQLIDPRERRLAERSVGIVGFGRIGQILSAFLRPFNTPITIYDPYLPEEVLKKFNVKKVSTVLELVNNSEVVVLCAANNKGSEKIFGAKEIEALRKDALVVNVGRASLVDMPAFIERLKHGDITAMLDVFDVEPLEADSPLRSLKNAYLTPHRAGGVIDTQIIALRDLSYDFEAFFDGRERRSVLTEEMLTSLPE